MKRYIIIIITLIISSTIFAQNPSAVAVLDLDADGISPSESRIISARLRTDLFNTGKFTVLERDKMQEILDEQGFQLSACTTDECVIEVGKLIGVEKMIAGNIGKIGKLYTLTIRLVDVETGKVLQTATEDCKCDIETVVTQSVKNVAEILAGNKIQTETYSTAQRKIENPRNQDINKLQMIGINSEDYMEFKNSGLSEMQWYKYSNERNGAFSQGLKSFLIPGWGQLSMKRQRGYTYLGIEVVGWIGIIYSVNKVDFWENEYSGDNYDEANKNRDYHIRNTRYFILAIILNHLVSSIDAGITTPHYNEELKKKYKLSFTPQLNKYSKQPMLSLNINF